MWKTQVDGADLVETFPLLVGKLPIEHTEVILQLLCTACTKDGDPVL